MTDRDDRAKLPEGVRKRGSTFTALWWSRDSQSGKWKQHSQGGFATATKAKKFRTERLAEVQQDSFVEPRDKALTVKDFLEHHWLPAARSEATKSGTPRRESTVETYRVAVERWLLPRLGGSKLVNLTPKAIETALTDLREHGGRKGKPVSGRTAQVAHGVLRMALDYGVTHGYVTRNVAAQVRRPGAKGKPMTAWTVDEARAFLVAARDDRMYAAWLLLLSRGLRRGELAGLRWSDVDFDIKAARIEATRVVVGKDVVDSTPKTSAGRRTISLDDALVAALKDHRKRQLEERLAWGEAWTDTGLVFVREDGAALAPESISQKFERLSKRLGMRRIRLHDTRHTCASLLLAAGVPVKVVSELLGHADVRVTLGIYQHTTPEMHADAGARLTGRLLGSVT